MYNLASTLSLDEYCDCNFFALINLNPINVLFIYLIWGPFYLSETFFFHIARSKAIEFINTKS